jgi:hypothetical protein
MVVKEDAMPARTLTQGAQWPGRCSRLPLGVVAFGLAMVVAAVGTWGADQAPRKHAAAVPCQGAIRLDGQLDEAAWQQAPEHTGFQMPLSVADRQAIPADRQTFFRAVYDDSTLYLGIRCNEPKMQELTLQAARLQHDAAMWSDDDVEIYLDPVGDRTEYYQLAINPDGTQVDLYWVESGNTGKAGWSAEWQAAAFRGADFWSVEVALPFAMFHNRPAQQWADNWAFSLARTRTPKPAYLSQFSPADGYHDPARFGTLGPLPVARERYNLYPGTPSFRLQPIADGFAVTGVLPIENRGQKPFSGTVESVILASGAHGASAAVDLPAGGSATVAVPGAFVREQGKFAALFRLRSMDHTVMNLRCDRWFRYVPLVVRLQEPNYRNCVYATQSLEQIRGTVTVELPLVQVRGGLLRTTLTGEGIAPIVTESQVDSPSVAFALPCRDLAEGSYVVRCELTAPPAAGAAVLLAAAEVPVRKLPRAPAIEVRIDGEGNLLIDGRPVFIRGWYGSMQYCVGTSSFPQAQLPHSTNFMMGTTDEERADLNLYSLTSVTELIDEAKARLDAPLDDSLKAQLRVAAARTRFERNIIGYYISDEPECRGLSPVFLQSVRDYLAELDPFRFCLIVSRAPAEFMAASDVMCPHPYMNPMLREGRRQFGTEIRSIHRIMSEARDANDGSRAVWSMPQTFTYGGLYGQHPDFTESRWFTFTAIACGAKGIVPFIFSGYWNHLENRVAMDAVFEELTLLAPAWNAPGSDRPARCDDPQVDVIAKFHHPPGAGRGHTFVVAANQSREATRATITVPELARGQQTPLLVLRENRVVSVRDGAFTDTLAGLGVHVYTTLQLLPNLQSLDEIQASIAAAVRQPADQGNLLAQGRVRWSIGAPNQDFQTDVDLVDGRTTAAAWLPVYSDRSQCVINLAAPLTFSRVEFSTSTVAAADLDVWVDGAWKTLHQWRDELGPRLTWLGRPVTTDRLRLRPTAQRQGYGSWAYDEVMEMGIYE